MNNLQNYSQKNGKTLPTRIFTSDHYEVSIYNDAPLEPKVFLNNVLIIKKAFPNLPTDFFDILDDRVKANGFSNQRLMDAVAHVIDTCPYPLPAIAEFISFDKKVKAYTYNEICDLITNGDKISNYQMIKYSDRPKPVWIHINDVSQYNIKSEQ